MLPVFSFLPTAVMGLSSFSTSQCMLKAMIEWNIDPSSWQHLKKTLPADSVPFENGWLYTPFSAPLRKRAHKLGLTLLCFRFMISQVVEVSSAR